MQGVAILDAAPVFRNTLVKYLPLLAAGANMGVEDEYGPEVPIERVLGGKSPLNFELEEPHTP